MGTDVKTIQVFSKDILGFELLPFQIGIVKALLDPEVMYAPIRKHGYTSAVKVARAIKEKQKSNLIIIDEYRSYD